MLFYVLRLGDYYSEWLLFPGVNHTRSLTTLFCYLPMKQINQLCHVITVLIAYNILYNNKYRTLNPSTFSRSVNFNDKSTKLQMLLLSNSSQISCYLSETIATPRALPIKASKVCTCLKKVTFGNSRTEERCFYKGLSYNI